VWESTGKTIRVSHLESLSKLYKRSLAAFFLPNPPQEPKPPKDFRVLPTGRRVKFEKKTLLIIRRAARLQLIAADLSDALGETKETKITAPLEEHSAEEASWRERQRLGISVPDQLGWRDESEALRRSRDAIEALNILVFSQSMPIDDARGFSLTHQKPWVIVVNSSDAIRARLFTLFHEYAHLLLHQPGICIPQREWAKSSGLEETEVWCNQFAAALLLPRDTVQDLIRQKTVSQENLPELATELSRRFKVSQEVVIRRLMTLNLISERQFFEQLSRFATQQKRKRKGGFASPALATLRGCGRRYTRLVLEARERGVITFRDVADFLSIRLKHLEKVSSPSATGSRVSATALGRRRDYSPGLRSRCMAITNHERVGKALDLLKKDLLPFVERELKVKHTQLWFEQPKASLSLYSRFSSLRASQMSRRSSTLTR
jgi:Zn-dependent peptidase ImmA (M78 family)